MWQISVTAIFQKGKKIDFLKTTKYWLIARRLYSYYFFVTRTSFNWKEINIDLFRILLWKLKSIYEFFRILQTVRVKELKIGVIYFNSISNWSKKPRGQIRNIHSVILFLFSSFYYDSSWHCKNNRRKNSNYGYP